MDRAHPLVSAFEREFRAGSYFEAHERMEEFWILLGRPPTGLVRGLIQLAVACEHYRRGNAGGASRVFERARKNIRSDPADEDSTVFLAVLPAFARVLADGRPEPLPPLPST